MFNEVNWKNLLINLEHLFSSLSILDATTDQHSENYQDGYRWWTAQRWIRIAGYDNQWATAGNRIKGDYAETLVKDTVSILEHNQSMIICFDDIIFRSWWSHHFSTAKMKIFCTILLLLFMVGGSVVALIFNRVTQVNDTIINKEPSKIHRW
jgi:hypothetical protein